MKRKNIDINTIDTGGTGENWKKLAEYCNQNKGIVKNTAYSDSIGNIDEYGLGVIESGHNFLNNGMGVTGTAGNYLLLYIAKGHQDLYMENTDEWVNAPAGSFIIYAPHQNFSRVYKGTSVAENYYIGGIMDKRFFEKISLEPSKIYKAEPSAEIENYFENIKKEERGKLPFNSYMRKTLFLQLVIALYRSAFNLTEPTAEMNDIEHAIFIMERDYNKNYSLEDFADMCNMSKYHFLRLFKKKMQTTPIAYRNQIRIKRAMEFLDRSNMPISKIGESVGFESLIYFCEAFRKTVGISPAKFRTEAQKKENKKSIDK